MLLWADTWACWCGHGSTTARGTSGRVKLPLLADIW